MSCMAASFEGKVSRQHRSPKIFSADARCALERRAPAKISQGTAARSHRSARFTRHPEEMDTDAATYPPLDRLKTVAGDVWIVDSGPMIILGMPLPVRMTVVRLKSGGLVLHSPTRFVAELKEELEELGPIAHLVAPNSAHWMFVKQWQDRLPDVSICAAPGLRHRRQVRGRGVRIDFDLAERVPPAWSDEIDHVIVPGLGGFAEVAMFHRGSRTLVLTDLVQNLEPSKLPPLMRRLAYLAGVTAPEGSAPIYLRALVRLKGRPAKSAAHRVLALQPDRVIFAHGRWFEENGTARLQKSLSWLL